MDDALARIERLCETKRLVPAELVIMREVQMLGSLLEAPHDDQTFRRGEKALISLFAINSGEFSTQCAIFIASKMLLLYRRLKSPDFWNMMNFSIEQTTHSAIIATGYLCRHIGEQVKS